MESDIRTISHQKHKMGAAEGLKRFTIKHAVGYGPTWCDRLVVDILVRSTRISGALWDSKHLAGRWKPSHHITTIISSLYLSRISPELDVIS